MKVIPLRIQSSYSGARSPSRSLSDRSLTLPRTNPSRWFTPTVEVPLCGHATLATAAILFSPHSPSPISPSASHITFRTLKSGNLVAHRRERGKIALDFPASMGVLEGRKTEGEEFAVVKKAVESAAPGLKGAVRAVAWGGFGPIVEIDPEVGIEGVEVDASYFVSRVEPRRSRSDSALTSPFSRGRQRK